MGRNNLLDLTLDAFHSDDAPPVAATVVQQPAPVSGPAASGPTAPAISGLRDSMRHLSENGVIDLDPSMIESSELQDRLSIDNESVLELADSIRKHGQQVPVLVRPVSGQLNRYKIVYGRRRLAAIRLIGGGQTVKAIVRSLDDKAAIIAQGQENSLRSNPTFIEKAVFIGAMREHGYDRTVIQDALGLSRQAISTYTVVLDAIPMEAIEAIGAAPEVGRRPWTELCHLVREDGVDILDVVETCSDALEDARDSSERFEIVIKNCHAQKARAASGAARQLVHHGSKPAELRLSDGRRVGKVRSGSSAVEVKLSLRDHPEFGQWIGENAERLVQDLHDRWLDERKRQG